MKKLKGFFTRLGRVRTVLLFVFAAIFVASGIMLAGELLEYKKGENLYESLAMTYLSVPATRPDGMPALPTSTTAPETPPPGETEMPEEIPPEEVGEPEPVYVQNYAPDIWPDVDFDGLRQINGDTAAWLLCVGTNINYPVVYSSDNDEYLNRLFDGRAGKSGSVFVDYRHKGQFSEKNTIIYGHYRRDHTMFWTLSRYKQQWFYNAHPTMRLILPEGKFEVQLFAGYVSEPTDEDAWRIYFATEEDYAAWIERSIAKSMFSSNVSVSSSDQIVTFSTCSYEFKDAKFVVLGKLVPV